MDLNNGDFKSLMSSFMQNAEKMQETFRQAFQQANEKNKQIETVGKAGGDLVVVHATGNMQITRLELKPELFQEKPEVIAELIIAAANQALQTAREAAIGGMKDLAKQMGL